MKEAIYNFFKAIFDKDRCDYELNAKLEYIITYLGKPNGELANIYEDENLKIVQNFDKNHIFSTFDLISDDEEHKNIDYNFSGVSEKMLLLIEKACLLVQKREKEMIDIIEKDKKIEELISKTSTLRDELALFDSYNDDYVKIMPKYLKYYDVNGEYSDYIGCSVFLCNGKKVFEYTKFEGVTTYLKGAWEDHIKEVYKLKRNLIDKKNIYEYSESEECIFDDASDDLLFKHGR